jgi:hypothetical protein
LSASSGTPVYKRALIGSHPFWVHKAWTKALTS